MAAKSIEELRTSQQKMSEELSSRIDGFSSRIEEMQVHVDQSIDRIETQVLKFTDELISLKQMIKQLIDKDSVAEVIDIGPLLKSEADLEKIVSPNAERKEFDKMTESILTDSNSFPGIQLIKKAEELFPSKIEVVKVAYQVFDEMTSPVPAVVHSFSTGSLFGDEGKDDSSPIKVDNQLVVELEQLHPLKFESLRDTRQLFDKMTGPISIKHNDENDSHENLVLPTIDLLKILSYGEAAPEFHSLKLEGLKNARHVFDKMPSNLNVELWVVKVLMVVFDPGGSSWLHNGCDAFELINGCDQSSGIKAGSVLSLMSEKRASTKFLRCAEWSDVQEVKQALELMGKWVPIDVCDALELLSPVFESEEVRAYAVSVLERADDEELQCYLLQLDNFDEPIRSPLVPSVLISGIIPSESSIFKSALHPLRLVFRTANGGNCKIIFKKGDDLRQDQLVIQMVTLMDRLLKLENLDLHLTPYEKQNIGYSLVIQVQNFGAEIFSCSSHMLLILFLDGLTNGLDLVSSSGTWLCLLFPLCANFVWDPGLCVGHFRLHPWGQGCF